MVFDKTGRDTTSSKVQRFPLGMEIIDGGRLELDGVHFKDDFCHLVIDTTNRYNVNTEGTSAAVDILEAINGVVQIDTGTDVDNRNCIATPLLFSAARGVIAEFRIRTLTSDADLLMFCGLTDAVTEASTKLPIKDAAIATATLDFWADDCVGFAVRAETSDNIFCVSSAATASDQLVDSGSDLVLETWMVLRIELDTSGNAKFYIDGTYVGAISSAVTAADPLCLFLGGLITDGSTAAFIQMDYWAAYQARTA